MDDANRRIDKIFLLHIWACVPFAPLWIIYAAGAPDPRVLDWIRIIAAVVAIYLTTRTWIVFCGGDPTRWEMAWPVIDIALVTLILVGLRDAADPSADLYLLAIAYAVMKLPPRQAFFIAGLAILGLLSAGLYTGQWLHGARAPDAHFNAMAVIFRHFFLLLMASLIYFLRRERQRVAEQLALREYQRELSAEIHDGIQHDLVLIARRLDLADAVACQDPARAAHIAVEQRDVARRASDELRFLVRQLRPDVSETDFVESLRQHLAMLSERVGLPVELECQGDASTIPAAYQHPILRIVQESITNAVKHAAPSRMHVCLRRGVTRYTLHVDDDGAGFDPSEVGMDGYGLQTMRARAEALGGSFRVLSQPGKGTRVSIRLPLRPLERRRWFRGMHTRTPGGR